MHDVIGTLRINEMDVEELTCRGGGRNGGESSGEARFDQFRYGYSNDVTLCAPSTTDKEKEFGVSLQATTDKET